MARKKRQIGEPDTSKAILPGRQTVPKWSSYFGMLPYNHIPRRQYEQYDISKLEMSALSASQLLSLLPDLSPDVSLAVWNVLRLGSEGFDYTVKDASGQDDENAKEILDGIVGRVSKHSGGIVSLIVQWLQTGMLQGAVAGEVALTEGLNEVDDFYAVDPFTISFRRDEQMKPVAFHRPPGSGIAVDLNPEKFWYIPIDPQIDDPYGRPPAAPVLQEVWFDIAVITDLRRVIHNQGWPRIDIKLLEETLVNCAPPAIKSDAKRLRDWLNERIEDVKTAYDELAPDDSFVHYDSVEIKQSEASGKLFDATAVVRVIERRMIKALKQLPILMASNEATTETHGTVQWQIFVSGLRSLQAPIEFILSRMMELALRVQGIQGRVECWFDPIRTTDRLADANAERVEINNAIMKWRAGWQTWEESSIEVTGSAPPEGVEPPDPASFAPVAQMSNTGVPLHSDDPDTDRLDAEIHSWIDGR